MDFVIGLPLSKGNNAILVAVCQLTKQRHYIPYFVGNEGTTTEAIA